MKIEVLGTDCIRCEELIRSVRRAVEETGVSADVRLVSESDDIIGYGVFITPALVIDGKVVSSGKALPVRRIKDILIRKQKTGVI